MTDIDPLKIQHAVENMYGSDKDTWASRHEVRERLMYPPLRPFVEIAGALANRYQVADSPETAILDVGTGLGGGIVELRRRFPNSHLAGVDINPRYFKNIALVLQAAGMAETDLREGYAQDLPWPPSSFDAIISCYSAFHFTPNFRSIREHLKPSGLFVAATANTDSIYNEDEILFKAAQSLGIEEPFKHTSLFNSANGQAILDEAGFNILETISTTSTLIVGNDLDIERYLSSLAARYVFYLEEPHSENLGRPLERDELEKEWKAAINSVGREYLMREFAYNKAQTGHAGYFDFASTVIYFCRVA